MFVLYRRKISSAGPNPAISETVDSRIYFSIFRLFFTENMPSTPLTARKAKSLSRLVETIPSSVTCPFLTMMWTEGVRPSLFPGADSQLFYVVPKITPLRIRDFDLAKGLLYRRPLPPENASLAPGNVGQKGQE